MSQTKKLFALAFSGLAFSLFTPFNIALAAEARAIEEIIVQARRQDETLQDVPVTITSVGSDQPNCRLMSLIGMLPVHEAPPSARVAISS